MALPPRVPAGLPVSVGSVTASVSGGQVFCCLARVCSAVPPGTLLLSSFVAVETISFHHNTDPVPWVQRSHPSVLPGLVLERSLWVVTISPLGSVFQELFVISASSMGQRVRDPSGNVTAGTQV